LLPWLLVLPAMALAVWLIVGVSLGSLQRVADQVRHRDSRQLGPIEVAQVPQEIQGLVAAVNGLLARLDRALDGERSFTADAAHELRTPLAALRLHAENLAAARDEQERQRSLTDLRVSVERSQRLIDQLLALARLDPLVDSDRALQTLDLAALLAKVMAELSGQADARRISLQLDRGNALPRVPGEEIALGVLFRNLVDNALRYSPSGSEVRVAIARATLDDGRPALQVSVEDQGPGIAEDERELAFERFHRGLRQAASGSGLGLAIARRIVELHQGSIRLLDAPAGQGLRVEVLLPLSRPPSSPAHSG
jgi:two-component system sensor histidine kinase QseC